MSNKLIFEEMYDRHVGELYAYICDRLGVLSYLAEDVLIVTMATMASRMDKFKSDEGFRSYLYRVADSEILHAIEKEKKHVMGRIPFEDAIRRYSAPRSGLHIEDETEAAAEALCKKLPEGDRDLFRRRFIENKTLKQISKETSVPYSTVRLHIERIRKHVKEIIREEKAKGGGYVR